MGASIIAVGLLVAACGGSSSTSTSTSTSRPSPSSTTAESTVPSSVAPAPRQVDPGPAPSTREQLAALRIDDRPSPQGRYDRGAWPHWDDIEGNGCDARQDALIAWSVVPATVDRTRGCRVITGSWISPYDGVTTSVPGTFDVDHLVPLENAFNSGGWQWDSTRRRAFANDPRELVVTSASSNRSKGSDPPDAWRPANRDAWCAYATGWVAIKVTWGLTATTEERDALGQMLDTCGPAGAVWPGVGAAVAGGGTPAGSTDAPPPTPDGGGTGGGSGGGEVYYANCSAARAAGAAPIRRGDPGYRSALDGDKDGVACE
ncbi:MAG: excalibur calcium-binding domain-containing protein [Acidobacteria bacterium]|nr:excalibur calcium-binding domain-containing protein [Acidobacteriota bacterium]